MGWDWALLVAGVVVIGLWSVAKIQQERRQEREEHARRMDEVLHGDREPGPGDWPGLRPRRRRRWGDGDRS